MTWQEELRKLDEDLASGTLSADAYRARRDQILSAAVTSGDPAPQQEQGGDRASATQIIEPLSPPGGFPQGAQNPLPSQQPPQQQGPMPGAQPEATQVVGPHDTASERTQAVPAWQVQQPGPYQQGPQSPPGGFAAPQQPLWNVPQEDPTPPWAGSDLPPIAPTGGFEWGDGSSPVSQGPESFDSEPKSSGNGGRKVLFSALAVVVAAGLGVAVWLLFFHGGNTPQGIATGTPAPTAASPTTKQLPAPPPAKPEPADDKAALITPPGTPRNGGGDFDLATLKSNKLLPDSVISSLTQGNMTSGRLNTSTDGSITIGMFSLTLPNADTASQVASQYADTQKNGGLPANEELAMQGVPVFSTRGGSGQAVFRSVYVLYSRVIIVETFGSDRTAVQDEFKTVLEQQVEHAPPTQRNS